MDITGHWPFTVVEDIPEGYLLIVDTNTLIKKKEATPKKIGKNYTMIEGYPLLVSKKLFKQMREAKRTGNKKLLPKVPMKMKPTELPHEIKSMVMEYIPVSHMKGLEEALDIDCKKLVAEIKELEPFFSLTKYLRKIKREKEELESLKDTFAWKLYNINSSFSIVKYDDHIISYKFPPNEDIEDIDEHINKLITEYGYNIQRKENQSEGYTKLFIQNIPDTEQLIFDLEKIDRLSHPYKVILNRSSRYKSYDYY